MSCDGAEVSLVFEQNSKLSPKGLTDLTEEFDKLTNRRSPKQSGSPLTDSGATGSLRMKKHILIYGLCGGVLIVILKLVEYRFLVIQQAIFTPEIREPIRRIKQ